MSFKNGAGETPSSSPFQYYDEYVFHAEDFDQRASLSPWVYTLGTLVGIGLLADLGLTLHPERIDTSLPRLASDFFGAILAFTLAGSARLRIRNTP